MTVGLISLVSPPVSNLTVNITYDTASNTTNAPQSFFDNVNAAVTILKATITDNITFNFVIGYDSWLGNNDTSFQGGAQSSGLSQSLGPIAYSSLYTAMQAKAGKSMAANSTFATHMLSPSAWASDSHSYSQAFNVWKANAKVLGLSGTNAHDLTSDANIGVGSLIPTGLVIGAILHEMSESLGRVVGSGPWNLGSFSGAGVWLFSGSNSTPHYISVDGGTTSMQELNTGSGDFSDFQNSGSQGTDIFNANLSVGTFQGFSVLDKRSMDILGYTIAP